MVDSPASPAAAAAAPHDVVIVGGGLAGGLIALALHRHVPGCRFLVIEAGRTLGGHHRWSWFETDIRPKARGLMAGFALNGWDEGYDITFPGLGRTLPTAYRSLASAEFHRALMAELAEGRVMLGTKVAGLDAGGVTLADGTRLAAKRVIDCRAFKSSKHLAGGWQVFLGQHFRCETPHGLTRPVIMDASVDQVAPHGNGAAYRFVYVLPLSPTEVFVEDTYYADQPKMDAEVLKGRVAEYARRHGWQGEVIDQEAGILPVISGGDFRAALAEVAIPGVALAGARGGFSHPLTSYTLPFAVDNALAIAGLLARRPDVSGSELAAFCKRRATRHWGATAYYRMLSRMLFEAAEPDKRVVVFEHFYALKGRLVERFYAGRSTWPDRLRILTGKPPVAIPRAIRALFSSGKPLNMETPA
ncbi:lycopene beta-cyclase CrtY [Porphyrobacter sp. CACIAM 03H1]|uniref:lycopene beta-cyclase CrtY n=1 Tax=Porphyrobacter sp. CACIAM 03H1 TaxID=2003315 RepID=UPI000B5A80EC|nr:lycopene beta-cyclase CrtY [Porphyrobacter sp. CACIAM 03H1]ASJ90375.1 lycopene cyclase [Porphyrobacter sp. CACIAM 03H1]